MTALRGEVWLADLSPTRGHEQSGRRPVLVVSNDAFNRGPAGLLVVLPLTSRLRPVPRHVQIDPPDGGVRITSVILCEAIRSISIERLSKRLGRAGTRVMQRVDDALRILLRL